MLDQLSPVAPARVRVVLLPIGQIKRARFLSFVERLRPETIVQLGDISPDGRPHRNMFSPLAFPTGKIVYDLTTFYPAPSHVALSPFELYREPLVIIAIADAKELDQISYRGSVRKSLNGNGPPKSEHGLRELEQELKVVIDRHPKGLVHQLLLFDHISSADATPLPEGIIAVPPPAQCKRTTLKTIMCDISSILLAEMTTLANSLKALHTIESPSQLQILKQFDGTAWQTAHAGTIQRRNSQYGSGGVSRSASPAANLDRSHVRMSMPAQFRPADSNNSSPSGRSTPNGARSELPTTFDQIVGANPDSKVSQKPGLSRLVSSDSSRDRSRDRVSVQGFGPGSVSERSRNIGKGRIGIVLGSLYLQAGRWVDATRELTEAASIAKYNLDHLWHAKALDYILVSMLMQAWIGLDFQIPQICYVTAEKAPQQTSASDPKGPASSRLVSLKNLTTLLPELLDRILNLYTRSANNTGETLPQFPFSETAIRFSKLSAAIHLAGGALDDDVLQLIVAGIPSKKHVNLLTPRLTIRPTRTEIYATLSRGLPTSSSSESLSLVDRTIILSGIASVLGSVGYYRKKAMIMRELVSVLIPGLIQARVKGAAEMGIHPAAGLAALNSVNGNSHGAGALDLGEGDVENGVDTFLGLLSKTYGVVTSDMASGGAESQDDSDDATIIRIMHNATTRAFGGRNLKMDVLRSCINLSEALPDFHGVLRFTADLLRTAGSGIAPGPRSEYASPSMSREEQVRLATNITRTLGAAKHLGVKNLQAEYWDEFLVRGVELEALSTARTPIPHTKKDLPGAAVVAATGKVNPFIYNPFLRPPDAAAVEHLLVAGEGAVFRVTLQNPYEFDIEIESMKLESDGAEFVSTTQRTVIGPYRTQILPVSGTPKKAGQLKITGCIILVRGCRERRFPIFHDPWSPQSAIKIKSIGIASIFRPKQRPNSTDSRSTNNTPVMTPPKSMSLALNVIDRQPVVVVKSTTLSQSAIMVLEGERRIFSITLQNLSTETPADLLLFSFKDSTQAPLQTALSSRDASPAELYEFELLLARKQSLRWLPKEGETPYIAPGSTATFEMEILGKPGLTHAIVQIDYAYLGVPANEVEDKFHTRQVSLPLTITVNASLELSKMDILPLTGNIPRSLWEKEGAVTDGEQITPHDHCLLTLDLRNAWPSSLHVHLGITNGNSIEEDLLPGNATRLMFPIPRIFLEDPARAIPALDPSRQRQFVVSAGKISAESERTSREAFWYREEILKMIKGTWTTSSGSSRTGEIELRGIRLTQRMIDAVKIPDIGIEILVNGSSGTNSQHHISTDGFDALQVRISNRSNQPIHPLLRIQPSIRSQSHRVSLDISRKIIWNGTLQQTLPILPAHGKTEVEIGITALCRGEFEINASVEETRLIEPLPNVGGGETGEEVAKRRERASTRSMMDAVLGKKERRVWCCREGVLVVVGDAERGSESSDDGNDDGSGSSDEEE